MLRGNLIIDLQFGSTGKGLIAGVLAERDAPDTVATAWAANAGHTYIDKQGNKFVHTMLANGIVSRRLRRVLIGPGSLIDPVNLAAELAANRHLLDGVDILIHPHAAVITQEHRDLEAGPMTKIGSTKKGVGEAAIQRIRRDPDNMNTAGIRQPSGGEYLLRAHPGLVAAGLGACLVTVEQYQNALDQTKRIQIEGAQGYSLSMYHGFYPYTTSRDVTTHQVLADVGLPVRMARHLEVVGTARTFPIRVANRFDEAGNQIGWSGPGYDDQIELDWQRDLGREPELTTVTKLPRRIFTFSPKQLREAVRMCGCTVLFLNFVNYARNPGHARTLIEQANRAVNPELCYVGYVGMGPAEQDVFDITAAIESREDEDRAYASLDSFIGGYYPAAVTA